MNQEVIDLRGDKDEGKMSTEKLSPSKTKKELEKNESIVDLSYESDIDKKRKREVNDQLLEESTELDNKEVSTVVGGSDKVVEYKVTSIRSSIKKKMPLEVEEETVSTVLTETVSVSSPTTKRSSFSGSNIKKKLPLEDDEVIMTTTSPIRAALKSDSSPPWWFNLATDIGDDIINVLKKGKVDE